MSASENSALIEAPAQKRTKKPPSKIHFDRFQKYFFSNAGDCNEEASTEVPGGPRAPYHGKNTSFHPPSH